ncbi:hypothetical protein E2562_020840 [Oryza meyeriana var. granulata]|uniref:Uncharacterized protein n=1 Tax=Oryza meyeriana var. granulata TaxID=110450 RepID=A0A6G1FAE7_9ORYZ|nr:hypothetical protein E2562_020840 [Oryza meyeriana var. granulata]
MRLLCCTGAASGEEVFGPRRELTGVQPLVDALPPAARMAAELAVAAAVVAAGYGIGLRARGGSRAVAVAGFVVVSGGGSGGGRLGWGMRRRSAVSRRWSMCLTWSSSIPPSKGFSPTTWVPPPPPPRRSDNER